MCPTSGGSGDLVIYNGRADRHLAAARGFDRAPSIEIISGAGKFVTKVPTQSGAPQVAYDESNNIVYTTERSPQADW